MVGFYIKYNTGMKWVNFKFSSKRMLFWEQQQSVSNKTTVNLKTSVSTKQSTPNFPKNKHFLLPDTHTYVCISRGKKCSFFGKFDIVYFLVTLFLRFAHCYLLRVASKFCFCICLNSLNIRSEIWRQFHLLGWCLYWLIVA